MRSLDTLKNEAALRRDLTAALGYTPEVGTVIGGTLRADDLLPAFLNELKKFEPNHRLVIEAETVEMCTDIVSGTSAENAIWNDERISELISDIHNALAEKAPDGLTFGNTEGDGADFGWWPIEKDY